MPPSDAAEYEKWLAAYAFHRQAVRSCKSKRLCDCGHWVDGTRRRDDQLYRYSVWRTNDMPRGVIEQRTDCEVCARVDSRG